MKIGIIGCGNISATYLQLAPQFKSLDIEACSDLDDSAARALGDTFNIQAMSIASLLADESIGLVINLTIPSAHSAVSSSVLEAGKHVFSEKPYVLSLDDGLALQAIADKNGLRIGAAPDTFLGGAHQCARQLIDSGRVGRIVGGSCYFMNHGMEDWHPSPESFYQPGGGPMLDMGVYYISNLVQLVGPVKRVMAMSSRVADTRTIGFEARQGETVPVDVATSVNAILEFHTGAQITLSLSWDVWQHEHNRMELYGSGATLHVPDPNFFGGQLRVAKGVDVECIHPEHPFAIENHEQNNGEFSANYRGAGLADMIDAIANERPHRCDNTLALHVIDVMISTLRSGETGESVLIETSCERPTAMNAAAAAALLL